MVTVLALVGLTKKRFGHFAILKNLSLRSPSLFERVQITLQKVKILHPRLRNSGKLK